jgi:5-methylcytosine-specific restriction endonuclease McrA
MELYMVEESLIRLIWAKTVRPIVGYDSNYHGLDYLGNLIRYKDYGNDSLFGWELDHILPKALGGQDVISNLRALHWKANASLGSHLAKIF